MIGQSPAELDSDWSRPVSAERGHTSGTGSKVGCSETICTEGPDRQITIYKTLYNISFKDDTKRVHVHKIFDDLNNAFTRTRVACSYSFMASLSVS